MMTSWFLTFGAMALPIAFALFLVYFGMPNVPILFYYLAWFVGTLSLFSFVVALKKSFKEDSERKEAIEKSGEKSDENFRSAMKTMEAIKGQLEGLRNDVRKSDKNK